MADRRIARSKVALRDALLTLMSEKSFSAITITEIVERANYNRGTFYTHYENKEGLLDEVISELIDELIESFRAPYGDLDVFRVDELTANSVKIFEHIHDRAPVYTTLFHSDVLPVIKEKMFGAIKKLSSEELEQETESINRELMMVYSIHALMGLVFHWIEGGFQYTPAYMQDQLIKMINWRPTAAKTHVKK
ncbi:TetR/AcrR family transcriptional regulator [Paenibacillus sp. 1011MAR3C5]|uniref:TetR/AcrR family transcriptional regulator n=1 Tax=Paenibacillus sp. 1011MAR3C5 TaxID=1675787 RepID=UPI000E6C119B|nr:TetR/AcrR family transcriptional regulator [Paenibacillus sp. 1011MAR3C5]RJE83269.1 TetR/AcrR family transcriptional regulator [Paenibacillus sp. 1011MAR3C5]